MPERQHAAGHVRPKRRNEDENVKLWPLWYSAQPLGAWSQAVAAACPVLCAGRVALYGM